MFEIPSAHWIKVNLPTSCPPVSHLPAHTPNFLSSPLILCSSLSAHLLFSPYFSSLPNPFYLFTLLSFTIWFSLFSSFSPITLFSLHSLFISFLPYFCFICSNPSVYLFTPLIPCSLLFTTSLSFFLSHFFTCPLLFNVYVHLYFPSYPSPFNSVYASLLLFLTLPFFPLLFSALDPSVSPVWLPLTVYGLRQSAVVFPH